MEKDKISALRDSGGDFEQLITLSPAAGREVQWWMHMSLIHRSFSIPLTTIIYSDASLEGWWATDSISTVGAPWQVTDALMHINVLELTAAHFALLHLAADARGVHIQLKLDNLTAVAYINKMGGTHSPECNQVAQQIWEWAVERGIWLSAAYIPGESNVVADFHSRCFHENKEWALKVSVFDLLGPTYGSPGIDLFASSRNAKLPTYISWLPDQLVFTATPSSGAPTTQEAVPSGGAFIRDALQGLVGTMVHLVYVLRLLQKGYCGIGSLAWPSVCLWTTSPG